MYTNKNIVPKNPFNQHLLVNLPSNLLHRRNSQWKLMKKTLYSTVTSKEQKKMVSFSESQYNNNKYQQFVEEQPRSKKQVLYKRLSNISIDNHSLTGLSFSKLLAKIIVKDPGYHESIQQQQNSLYQQNSQKTSIIFKCLRQKQFKIQCLKMKETKNVSKSMNVKEAEISKKIFSKFYNPQQFKNKNQQINQQQKYIYKHGKRIQCKRIHNFYTSHKYKRGCDRYFRHTVDGSMGN